MKRWKEAAEKYEYDLPLEDEGCQLYTARQMREAFQHAAAEGYAEALREANAYADKHGGYVSGHEYAALLEVARAARLLVDHVPYETVTNYEALADALDRLDALRKESGE